MIVLAVDSSGREGSLALARADTSGLEIIELLSLEGGNFSAQLVPQIAALLARHSLAPRDIAGFAVAVGPGSFTGLRVGLAAVKGLAEALAKPVAAVSRLEAIARSSGKQEGNVLAALDAGRRQAFVGEYELHGESASCTGELLLLWDELGGLARGRPVATPDPSLAEALRQSGTDVLEIQNPRADAVARIGWKKLISGDVADVTTLEANYLRRTDAEILVAKNLVAKSPVPKSLVDGQ
jgi:tRNA threonylcarbamoyladenosine biosynthesis protein TsaB